VIPARLLEEVAQALTKITQPGKGQQWIRPKHDREEYSYRTGQVEFKIRYLPGRVDQSVIEFSVSNNAGEEMGGVVVGEDDREMFDVLSELLFAIQRAENRGNMKQVAEELLKLLPEERRVIWWPKGN
jgi:hypothetical protein